LLHGGLIGLLGKAKGIKESNRRKNTGKLLSSDKGAEGGSLLFSRIAGAKAVAERLMRAAANFAFCIVF
jgi:hypothetical protein